MCVHVFWGEGGSMDYIQDILCIFVNFNKMLSNVKFDISCAHILLQNNLKLFKCSPIHLACIHGHSKVLKNILR